MGQFSTGIFRYYIFFIVGLISTILAFAIRVSFDYQGIFLELWQLIFIASFSFSLLFTIAFYYLINQSITYVLKIFITSLIITSIVSTSNLLVISQNNNLHHRSMLATDAVIRNMV